MREEKEHKVSRDYENQLVLNQLNLQKLISNVSRKCIKDVKQIGGVDLAYWSANGFEYAVCCIVVIDRNSLKVIETNHLSGKINMPYIPGFLSFRELPLILETLKLIKNKMDLIMFDGNGYLHPRHMGIATHAGIILDIPTIGVAKSYHMIDSTKFIMPDNEPGKFSDIIIDGDVYGRALRTQKDVKPVYVSVGNFISLDDATNIVLELTSKESHIPVPTRMADIETHRIRAEMTN